MTDYIPPTEPGDDGSGDRENAPDQGSTPPTSTWGQAPRPADWRPDDATGGPSGPSATPDQGYYRAQQDPYGTYGAANAAVSYRRASQATTALVLVVVGLFCCGVPSIIGTVMAKADLNAIRRGETDPQNKGAAQAGFILGIIASILWLAVAALWFLAVLLSIATAPT